jgi:hypothetical protein
VGEQHLDLFSLAARDDVSLSLGDGAGLVAGGFVDRSRDFARRLAGTALGLQRAGAIEDADPAAFGQVAGSAPEEIVLQFGGGWDA